MSPYVPFSRHARVLGGTARRVCAYSVNDQRAHAASTRGAQIICCSGGTQRHGDAAYLGEEANEWHVVPPQINRNNVAGLAR